jgi:hypothetical protein
LIDVTCLTIGADPYVFRIPVSVEDVEAGDLLVRSDSPLSLLFVERPPRDGRIQGIDPRSDEAVEILIPDKSLDIPTLLVRVVSLFGGLDGIFGEGEEEEEGGFGGGGMWPLLMMGGLGGGLNISGSNNLALALALSRSRKLDSRILFLLLGSGSQTTSLNQALLLSALSGRQGLFGSRRTAKAGGKRQSKPAGEK